MQATRSLRSVVCAAPLSTIHATNFSTTIRAFCTAIAIGRERKAHEEDQGQISEREGTSIMNNQLTVNDIKYICRHMMGVDWVPSFIDIPPHLNEGTWLKNWTRQQEEILRILSTCQSKLEIMYFLGIVYWLYKNASKRWGMDNDYPSFYTSSHTIHDGQRGIHIGEPWHGYSCECGPSAMLIIPQWKSPDKEIHHDLGIFTASDNGGGPPWHFYAAVEIEGYGVHKVRRHADKSRYANLSYIVTSVREELTQPTDWFRALEDDGPDSYEKNVVPGVDFICPIEKLPSKETPQCTNCGK